METLARITTCKWCSCSLCLFLRFLVHLFMHICTYMYVCGYASCTWKPWPASQRVSGVSCSLCLLDIYACTYAHMHICTYAHMHICTYVCGYASCTWKPWPALQRVSSALVFYVVLRYLVHLCMHIYMHIYECGNASCTWQPWPTSRRVGRALFCYVLEDVLEVYIYIYIYIYILYVCIYLHTYIHTCIHTCIHTVNNNDRAEFAKCLHPSARPQVCLCMMLLCACMHIYAYIYIYIYICMYMYVYRYACV
jgi:hypothetical protein